MHNINYKPKFIKGYKKWQKVHFQDIYKRVKAFMSTLIIEFKYFLIMPEATIVILDNSEYSINGDYEPTRWMSQIDAAGLLIQTKLEQSH